MLSIEKSTQTLVFFVFENFVTSLLQNLGSIGKTCLAQRAQ